MLQRAIRAQVARRLVRDFTTSASAASAAKPEPSSAEAVRTALAQKWDAIIVGGGHNGLVSAAYLAKAGKRVLVLERRHILGGAAVTEELHDGFRFSRCSYLLSLLRPVIIEDLGLVKRHGLRFHPREFSSYTPTPRHAATAPGAPSGMLLSSSAEATAASIAQYSQADAAAYPEYCERLGRVAAAFTSLLDSPPPDLQQLSRLPALGKAAMAGRSGSLGGMRSASESFPELASLARKAAALGADGPLLWEALTGPASRILDRWFESPVLKATLATDGVIGANVGPSTPGSAYVLIHHVMGGIEGKEGQWVYARGGMGAVSQSIASAAREAGATLLTGVDVRGLLLDESGGAAGAGGRWRHAAAAAEAASEAGDGAEATAAVRGVTVTAPCLPSGAEPLAVEAEAVLWGASPTSLFGGALPAAEASRLLPPETWSRMRGFDTAPASAKLNVALKGLPAFPAAGDNVNGDPSRRRPKPHHQCTIHFEEDPSEIDDAHALARALGRPSPRPIVELTIPSVLDDSLAPPGCHVANLFVQYAPYELTHPEWSAGWGDDSVRRRFMDSVYDVVEESAPGFRDLVLFEDLLTPPDLEREFGLPQGNIFHGAMSVDQLLWGRPAGGMARYRTPLGGLYLCASGAHPGGGVMGAPGRNSALALLADWRA
ncbi:hypothetical protein FNF29_02110 [Cafeteria roenbergensis]|uniref:Amine oxidase domain-containing protein n=1 Tax=Cafeteria roenbergensis TaxID=33653 RepID=A0A5A8CPJ1_CAFRO|nr:hypothetical protein FNF29_02110 [Cafeteria roenbergensis]|eukprot:KAA0154966.1 hypothetical protein FNF29_02110 [Cafeteria roenbergensis]